jgi:hypothetical protein
MNEENNSQIEDNFDELMALFEKDPDSFEKKRLEMIQSVIVQAPERIQRRLTGLQWRIDSEIKLAKTPMAGCLKVYQMMMDSVYGEGGLQDALNFTDKEINETIPNVAIINIKNSLKKSEIEE